MAEGLVKGGETIVKWVITAFAKIFSFFEEPFWLFALFLVIPLLIVGRESETKLRISQRTGLPKRIISGGKRPSTLRRLTYLRIMAIVLTILALAGASAPIPTNRQHLAVAIDVSDSITLAEREKARRAVLAVLEKMKPQDSVDLITFASVPRILAQDLTPDEAGIILESVRLSSDQSQNTNLESALSVTKRLFKESRGNQRILLLSDGRPNAGETSVDLWINSGYASAQSEVPIYTKPLGETGNSLVSLGLDLPETVYAGENTLFRWEVYSEYEQQVTVVLKMDGKEIRSEDINLSLGRRAVPLAVKAPEFGAHRIELEISDERGVPVPHATCGGVLRVQGDARVLVVKEATMPSPLTGALRTQGIAVQEARAENLAETLSGLASYSAVVLDNVPAFYLTNPQQEALKGFVAGGGGLLVVGGDSSLGRGEYYASRLEEILPVQTDTRQRLLFTRAKILYIIDQSGSMSELVGGVSKEEAALRGIAASLRELNPLDELGILAFSHRPNWVLPFTAASNQEIISQALSKTGEGGGTDMALALEEAVKGLSGSGPLKRHVVILSDGYTQIKNIEELCHRLQGMGVTITTIGVGIEVNQDLLESIAKWGDGQYYRATEDQIPTVILKETIRISRDLIQEGVFNPELRTEAGFLAGLEEILPIKGYLITKPKSMATVYLEVGEEKKDPLLACWRYGNGQVAVFTSDSGNRWLSPWSGLRLYNRFWSQLLRSIMKGQIDTGLRLTTRNEGGAVRLLVDATGSDRRLRSGLQLVGRMGSEGKEVFTLKETSLGRYEAILPITGRGIQEFEVGELHEKSWTVGAIWLPPSDEYQSFGPDTNLLSYLSSVTGGKLFSTTEIEIPSTWSWAPYPLRRWLIIIALFLFVIELAYRSASLGQVAMAKTALTAWWGRQQQILDTLRGHSGANDSNTSGKDDSNTSGKDDSDTSGKTTLTAYRYLAQKGKSDRDLEK